MASRCVESTNLGRILYPRKLLRSPILVGYEDYFLACKDSYDVENLLRKWKEKYLNARMKYDPKFSTSPIFVTDKDYEFSVDPKLITLVESDPFHG